MSDYRFGDDYKLNIYPKEAMGYDGLDMDKVESVEVERVDFIRKPDDKSRWFQLFGTPEKAARTLYYDKEPICAGCALMNECEKMPYEEHDACFLIDYDTLLEWLRGEGE